MYITASTYLTGRDFDLVMKYIYVKAVSVVLEE